MMQKSKEIIKQLVRGCFVYAVIAAMGGSCDYDKTQSWLRTEKIMVVFLLLVIVGAIITALQKQYDIRKYNGYMLLIISFALLIQVSIQGDEIFTNHRILICGILYLIAIAIGIIIVLFKREIIVIKNQFIKSIGTVALSIFGFLLMIILNAGKMFMGRRGVILMNDVLHFDPGEAMAWYLILFVALLLGMASALVIASIVTEK
jgi:hypothetical protein